MTETARLLLTAVTLTAVGLTLLTTRLHRSASGSPDRLVAQLHLSRWAALVLAVQGALTIGLAVAGEASPVASLEAALGLLPIAAGGVVLYCAPVPALQTAAVALGLHAALAFCHRPGLLPPDLAPFWFWLGQAMYSLYTATLCSLGSRK